MSKGKIENRLPEPQPIKEQKVDGTSVRPAIAKPTVVCSQSLAYYGRDLEHFFIIKYFKQKTYINLKEESVLQFLKFP